MINELPFVIEIKVAAPGKPGGRAAALLNAHLGVEQAAVFCRLLWRRSVVIMIVAAMLEHFHVIPPVALMATVLLFSTLALGASWIEWRTRIRFRSLVEADQN